MKLPLCFFIFICYLFQSPILEAQSCTPYNIYKEDFGGNASSPDIGTALQTGVTDYKYSASMPVEDGEYGIRKKVSEHKSSWHQLKSDHTGDGYMMLVNASYDPGKFYEKEITDLCQGSSFYFSVYVINLMKLGAGGKKDPDLRFVILNPNDHSIITETTTGFLPRYSTPTWEEFGIHFNLPTGLSSIILQIFNNADGGSGNDLVLDDITFSICGPPLQTTVSGMYQNGVNTCIGKDIDLDATITNSTYHRPQYQWQFGTNTTNWQNIQGANNLNLSFQSIAPEDSGWYRILAAEEGNIDKGKCRISSKAIPVNVWEKPISKITTNAPVCEGDELTLTVSHPSQQTTHWEGPDTFTSDKGTISFPDAKPNQSGRYKVKITNPGGCEASNQKDVTVQKNDLSISFKKTDSIICKGEKRTLDADNPGAIYLWNTGEITPQITVDTGGLYHVNVQKGVCAVSDEIQLYSPKTPKINLGVDTTICDGEPFYLHATYPDVEDYQWGNGSRDSVLTVTHPGIYSVTLSNFCGTAKDDIHILMEPCSNELIFPTAFTPNGDGQNDIFRPRVLIGLSQYELRIFNRWGQAVFETKDITKGWAGRLHGNNSPVGTYIWTASYKRTRDDKKIRQKGVITLIR